jgi:ABC-type transporter Mla subunit MlaD
MKKNLSDYLVALAVIVCSVILLGALTIALSGYRLHKPTRTLQLDYEDVTGIKVHSEVRYAGAPAGRVIAMKHLSAAQRTAASNKKDAVRVTIELDDSLPSLPNDIAASLGSDTMLSPKFVALSAGTPGKPTLPNNAVLEGTPAFGLDQITEKIGPVLTNANKLMENLNGTVTSVKSDLGLFLPKLAPVADSAKADLDDLKKTIQGLNGIETKASNVFSTADTFLGSTDQQLRKQMDELHVILLNLKVITTHAKALVDTLAEKPNRIIFSGKANQLTPEAEILKSREALPARKP